MRKEILRIASTACSVPVTHKRKPGPDEPVDTTRYKICIETETAVADGVALGAIFQQLGYTPARSSAEKYRSEWSHSLRSDSDIIIIFAVIDLSSMRIWAGFCWSHRSGSTALFAQLYIDSATCITDSHTAISSPTGSSAPAAPPKQHLTFKPRSQRPPSSPSSVMLLTALKLPLPVSQRSVFGS